MNADGTVYDLRFGPGHGGGVCHYCFRAAGLCNGHPGYIPLDEDLLLLAPLTAAILPKLVQCFAPEVGPDGRLHLGKLHQAAADALRDADPTLTSDERIKLVADRRPAQSFSVRLLENGVNNRRPGRRGGEAGSNTVGYWAALVHLPPERGATAGARPPPEVWTAQRLEAELLGTPEAPRSQEELLSLGFRGWQEDAPLGSRLREWVRGQLFLRSISITPFSIRPPLVPGQKVSECSRKYDALVKKVVLATAKLQEARADVAGAPPGEEAARRAALALLVQEHTKALSHELHMIVMNKSKAKKAATEMHFHAALSLMQRLMGKTGIMRSLNSRRHNNTARGVIQPDSTLALDEVRVPRCVLNTLTTHVTVRTYNQRRLIAQLLALEDGRRSHYLPPFLTIRKAGERLPLDQANLFIQREVDRNDLRKRINSLSPGDIVCHSLLPGMWVFFNRQPTLSANGYLAVRVVEGPDDCVIAMHPTTCSRFNADFDGDEMNINGMEGASTMHEIALLASANRNMIQGRTGAPVVGIAHDAAVGIHLLSREGVRIPWASCAGPLMERLPCWEVVAAAMAAAAAPDGSVSGRELLSACLAVHLGAGFSFRMGEVAYMTGGRVVGVMDKTQTGRHKQGLTACAIRQCGFERAAAALQTADALGCAVAGRLTGRTMHRWSYDQTMSPAWAEEELRRGLVMFQSTRAFGPGDDQGRLQGMVKAAQMLLLVPFAVPPPRGEAAVELMTDWFVDSLGVRSAAELTSGAARVARAMFSAAGVGPTSPRPRVELDRVMSYAQPLTRAILHTRAPCWMTDLRDVGNWVRSACNSFLDASLPDTHEVKLTQETCSWKEKGNKSDVVGILGNQLRTEAVAPIFEGRWTTSFPANWAQDPEAVGFLPTSLARGSTPAALPFLASHARIAAWKSTKGTAGPGHVNKTFGFLMCDKHVGECGGVFDGAGRAVSLLYGDCSARERATAVRLASGSPWDWRLCGSRGLPCELEAVQPEGAWLAERAAASEGWMTLPLPLANIWDDLVTASEAEGGCRVSEGQARLMVDECAEALELACYQRGPMPPTLRSPGRCNPLDLSAR